MKVLLLLISVVLLNGIALGALPKPKDIFGPNVPEGSATQDTYARLFGPITQRKVAEYIFNRADSQGNGKLNFNEFKKAYEILNKITWVPFPDELVEMEFAHGDILEKDNKINLEEFTLLCARMFIFWYQNPGVYVRTPTYMTQLLFRVITIKEQKQYDLENFPNTNLFDTYDWDASGNLNFQEFSACLTNVGTEYGIYLYFDYFFIRDYFDLISNADSVLNRAKFNNMIVPLMKNYISYSYSLLPVDNDSEEEEEEQDCEEDDYDYEEDYEEEGQVDYEEEEVDYEEDYEEVCEEDYEEDYEEVCEEDYEEDYEEEGQVDYEEEEEIDEEEESELIIETEEWNEGEVEEEEEEEEVDEEEESTLIIETEEWNEGQVEEEEEEEEAEEP